MSETKEQFALLFERPVQADGLEAGQIVVVDGHVVEVERDPDEPEQVRITIVRALAGVRGEGDQRVVLTVPRDMKIATARLHEGPPPPPPPSA